MTTRTFATIASSVLGLVLAFGLAGCATGKQWAVSGGDKSAGVVRVSYEYPEFREPTVDEAKAAELAANRCGFWGYGGAEPIEGQIRQCSNMDGTNCDQWRVTREYQCTNGARHGVAGVQSTPRSGAVANLSAR